MTLVEFTDKSGDTVLVNADRVSLVRPTWVRRDQTSEPEEFTMVAFGGGPEDFVVVEGTIAQVKHKLLLGTLGP